jgi:hypothetical protein
MISASHLVTPWKNFFEGFQTNSTNRKSISMGSKKPDAHIGKQRSLICQRHIIDGLRETGNAIWDSVQVRSK